MRQVSIERVSRWGLADLRREVDSNFALMRIIQDNTVHILMQRLASLSPTEQLRYLEIVHLKFFQSKLLEEPPYVNIAQEVLADYKMARDSMIPKSWLRSPHLPLNPENKVKRRNILKAIITAVSPLLGEEIPELDPSVGTCFEKDIGNGLRLSTTIDVGGNFHAFSYSHRILGGGDEISNIDISFLCWLGISSTTHWLYVLEPDLEKTVLAVKQMVELFLQALPTLVEQ